MGKKKAPKMIAWVLTIALTMGMIPAMVFASDGTASADKVAYVTKDGSAFGEYESIQGAVDAVRDDTTPGQPKDYEIIIADDTYNEAIGILQQENKNIVLKPENKGGVILTNTISIDGNGYVKESNQFVPNRANGDETLAIENIKFDLSNSAATSGVTSKNTDPNRSCMHNVTVSDCEFIGRNSESVIGVNIPNVYLSGGAKNITIKNCTGENLHALAQLFWLGGHLNIENCKLLNETCKSGINIYHGNTTDSGINPRQDDQFSATINNCDFDVREYAVRAGQGGTYAVDDKFDMTIKDSTLTTTTASKDDDGDLEHLGTIILRGDAPKNISIENSTLKNANTTRDSRDKEKAAVIRDVSTGARQYNFNINDNYWGSTGEPNTEMFAGFAKNQNPFGTITRYKKDNATVVEPNIDPSGSTLNQETIGDIKTAIENAKKDSSIIVPLPKNNVQISKDIFDKLKDADNKELVIQTKAESGTNQIPATFTFNSNSITNPNISVDTGISITPPNQQSAAIGTSLPSDAVALAITLAHEGNFPGPVKITIPVDMAPGTTVYIYYVNDSGKSDKLELIKGGKVVVSPEKTITFTLEHASDYVISTKEAKTSQNDGKSKGSDTEKGSPTTGDDFNPMIYMGIVLIAMLAAGGISIPALRKRLK